MTKPRRTFSAEFKLEAASLVLDEGYTFAEACRSLDVSENVVLIMAVTSNPKPWELTDEMWANIELLIPKPKENYPLGTHRKRVDDRAAMSTILFIMSTGCQWNALNKTGICSSSSAHRRLQEWRDAEVFERLWQNGLLECRKLNRIDWSWLSMDGAITKAPLAGSKN